MATESPGSPADQQPVPPRNKSAKSPYLALGIVFLAVGVGLSFGDSSTWVVFLALGIVFLAVSGGMGVRGKSGNVKDPDRE